MILAAGLGQRMRTLTADRPKPLLTLAGRPLIDHALDRLEAAGVRRVVVNLHWKGDMLRAHLAGRRSPEILFSDEGDALLDTGGGVARALPLLGEAPFFVVNGDAFWLNGAQDALKRLAARFALAQADALLLMHPTVRAIGYWGLGDYHMLADGRLRRRRATEVAPFVFTGVQILSLSLLRGAPAGAFSLNRLYDRAQEADRLHGLRHDGEWMSLNEPEALSAAEEALAA
jgi:MurNAc alpha-1-phosphate uridylyltransferase